MGKTTLGERSTHRMDTPKFVLSIFLLGVVVIGGAVFLGKSDAGEINVSAAIQSSNQKNIEANGDPRNNVGVVPEAFRNMKNGGLVPQEQQPENTQTETNSPSVEEANGTSTTESAEASTTEPVATEAVEASTPKENSQNAEQQ